MPLVIPVQNPARKDAADNYEGAGKLAGAELEERPRSVCTPNVKVLSITAVLFATITIAQGELATCIQKESALAVCTARVDCFTKASRHKEEQRAVCVPRARRGR